MKVFLQVNPDEVDLDECKGTLNVSIQRLLIIADLEAVEIDNSSKYGKSRPPELEMKHELVIKATNESTRKASGNVGLSAALTPTVQDGTATISADLKGVASKAKSKTESVELVQDSVISSVRSLSGNRWSVSDASASQQKACLSGVYLDDDILFRCSEKHGGANRREIAVRVLAKKSDLTVAPRGLGLTANREKFIAAVLAKNLQQGGSGGDSGQYISFSELNFGDEQ